ncbi:MAG TPA: hypothetical protein VFE53_02835 [Mucilaginibacter sp.]|jgi:hypothetical protein|nr:hypothetical protein [Mucilaginibacter sp.]
MHPETEYLRSIAEEIAARQLPDTINEPQADHRLLVEARRLEKAIAVTLRSIDNFTQRDTYHNDTLSKLVDICDLLFEAHRRLSPDTRVMLDLLAAIRQILPGEISPLLRLSKAFVFTQKDLIKTEWEVYNSTLRDHEIEPKLIVIAAIPFQRFFDGNEKLYWGDYTWLKGYAAKLGGIDWENADCNSKTEALMSLMIGRDFNHDRFFIYCKKYIMERVGTLNTKKRRLQEYAVCEKLVMEDTQIGLPAFDRHANQVSVRLLKWIKEETEALKTSDSEEYIGKLSVVWNIDTLALFFKLLWDNKVFRDVTLELFSQQIAAAFSSKGKGDFKAHSIFGRFYVKDREVLQTLEALFVKLLEDIRLYLK